MISWVARAKWRMEHVVERHPYSYYYAKKCFHLFPFLLPHDKSFLGFRHLIDHAEGLFLDVGANDGVSALSFRHINNTYRILSIEPNSLHLPTLRRVRSRIEKFDFMILAGGATETTTTLYTPQYHSIPIHSAASAHLEQLRASIDGHFPTSISRRIKYVSEIVRVVPLDSLDVVPNIVKIDAEGMEIDILAGLCRTIERYRPFMMVENNASTRSALRQLCEAWSYVIVSYDHRAASFQRVPEDGVRNVFCMPIERLDWLTSRGVLP